LLTLTTVSLQTLQFTVYSSLTTSIMPNSTCSCDALHVHMCHLVARSTVSPYCVWCHEVCMSTCRYITRRRGLGRSTTSRLCVRTEGETCGSSARLVRREQRSLSVHQ